jgi:hypothetical protein
MRPVPPFRRTAAATFLFALVAIGAFPASSDALTPVYIPAGVVDEQASVACVRTPEGGVEAIDLAHGRTLFVAKPPAKPLLIAAGVAYLLEARPGRGLQVAMYDIARARLLKTIDLAVLALPAWVSIDGSAGGGGGGREWTLFDVDARLDLDRLTLLYDARRMRAYGSRPAEPVDQVAGAAELLLDSGRVLRADAGRFDPPPLTRPAPPAVGARWLAAHARRADATLMLGGPPANAEGLLVQGDTLLGFRFAEDATVVLAQRFSAAAAPLGAPLRLDHGVPTDAVWVTLDRNHVLLRRAQDQVRYDLFDLTTGAPVDRLERPVDVAVVGDHLLFTSWRDDGRLVLESRRPGARRRDWRRVVRLPDPPPGPPIP